MLYKTVFFFLFLFFIFIIYIVYTGSRDSSSDETAFITPSLSNDALRIKTYPDELINPVLADTLEIQSTSDSITINKVKVNRGNCGLNNIEPYTLKFGKSHKYKIGCDFNDVVEVSVETDQGEGTFQMQER